MLKAKCAPLAGRRTKLRLGDWEGLPSTARPREEELNLGRELRKKVLAYGLEHCLTPAQREAVNLCCIQGLTGTQAARQLGVHPSTMNRRLRKALAKLQDLAAPASN